MKKNGVFCCTLLSVFGLICTAYLPDNFLSNAGDDLRTEDCFFNLCNTTEGYPSAMILTILERNKKNLPLFEDFFDGFPVGVPQKQRVPRSFPDKESELKGCKTVQLTRFPQVGRNVQDVRKIIVNVGKFKQELIMEICQCSKSHGSDGNCQQQFKNKDILTWNEKGTFEMDVIPVPSGCICSKT